MGRADIKKVTQLTLEKIHSKIKTTKRIYRGT